MSEYQYVHFLALDRPLDDKQLEYMRTQSTRAEITKWKFSNEYHFGDFHGNAQEMLRRGYDLHLHFANFGIRRLMFRLPWGLPWDQQTFDGYLPEGGLAWHQDAKGPGGILEIDPECDAGTFDYYGPDIEDLLDAVAPLRDDLISGDLRGLYVIWLAMTVIHGSEESTEPPLPAGMTSLPGHLLTLADFYELSPDLLETAAEGSLPIQKSTKAASPITPWLSRQSPDDLKKLVQRFLTEDAMGVRAETLALVRKESGKVAWPTIEPNRTFLELSTLANQRKADRLKKAADAKQKAHRAALKQMAAEPDKIIGKVEQLLLQRSRESYIKAAKTLVDLGEALGPADGPDLVQAQVARLRKLFPTLRGFVAELRNHGLLSKK